MSCVFGDKPLRIQLSRGGVIHAGSYEDYGGFTRGFGENREYVPKQKRVSIVCRWRGLPDNLDQYLVSNDHEITCKTCQKQMGLIEEPLAKDRFIIRKKSTGEFFKNTSTRCTSWSDSITDAFFFKRRHNAQEKCKHYRFETEDGRLLTYNEYIQLGRPPYTGRRVIDPDLEVKKVKFILE